MDIRQGKKLLTFILSFVLGLGLTSVSFNATSEDIDIFSVDIDNTVNQPNVLIVLDNSANWSRQAQQWTGCEEGSQFDSVTNPPPGGCTSITQGQSEVRAIQNAINEASVTSNVNIGLMLYRTEGASGDRDHAYIRSHVRPMSANNKSFISNQLNTMFNNINDPVEKRDQSNPFGNLFWEVYNYLAGDPSIAAGSGTPGSRADSAGYDSQYDNYRSPLTSTDSCTRTIVIFIANNTQSGPRSDSADNTTKLEALHTAGGLDPVTQLKFPVFNVNTTTLTADLGHSTTCYADASACNTAESAGCPATAAAAALDEDGIYNCRCNDVDFSSLTCGTPMHYAIEGRINEGTVNSDTGWVNDGLQETGEASKCQNNSPGTYTCPAQTEFSETVGNTTTVTQTRWTGCTYEQNASSCGNNNNKDLWIPKGTRETRVIEYTATFTTLAGQESPGCYTDASGCTLADFPASCSDGTYDDCACTTPTNDTGCVSTGDRFMVQGDFDKIEAQIDTTQPPTDPTTSNLMTDEWAKYLKQKGVPLPGTNPAVFAPVITYTIDVFNAQQHEEHSALLFNAAREGGGKYFQAKNEQAILDALNEILSEVQAVNTAFSSASLPVNATNRAQNENQVFIGLFRPDRVKNPVWFGNLKRYQLIESGNNIILGDKNSNPAINPLTGFITECAVSFWSRDSGDYWLDVTFEDPPAVGTCGTALGDEHSDAPDGPFVEKGATAQVQREGNDPTATPDATTGNYDVSRNMETLDTGTNTLVEFNTTNSGLAADIVNYTLGQDPRNEDGDSTGDSLTEPRASIHGDVVHSRPQPVNYGDPTGIVIYYGANDGTYRGVNASTGVELWSFVAPEHYSKLERLEDNFPKIRFFGDAVTFGNPKDYFFDGSTGLFQTLDNSKVYIYPTMRRGGRTVYGFNVTDPANPAFLWKVGCPNPGINTTGCTTGFTEMGQSWPQPNVAFIKGYSSGSQPIAAFGGGYDSCEDTNAKITNECTTTTGSGVYIVDAETGALVKHFDFNSRAVAADVAFIDVNQDEKVDFGYAVDTGGSIYRMDFVDSANNYAPLAPASWTFTKIAFTNNGTEGRKFLFAPALFQATANIVYLAIGTGDREHPLINQYPVTAPVLNRFYVFKDNLYDTDASTNLHLDDTTPDDASDTNYMNDYSNSSNVACDGSADILPNSPSAGWFIDLTGDSSPAKVGEQVVTSAIIASGRVFFSTNRATTVSQTACTNSLGEARGYALNLLNGHGAINDDGSCGGDRSNEFTGGGLPPSPVLSTVPVGNSTYTVCIGCVQLDGTVSSAIDAQKVDPDIDPVRTPVYWFKTGDTQ